MDSFYRALLAFVCALLVPIVAAPALHGQATAAAAGDWYITGTHADELVIIDGTKDEVAFKIHIRGRGLGEIVPAPDGKRVFAATNGRRQIEVVNLVTRKVEDVIQLAEPGYRVHTYGMVFSRDGRELYAHVIPIQELPDEYKAKQPMIVALDLATKKTRKIADVPFGAISLVALKDGKRLVLLGRDFYYVDIASGKIIKTYPLQGSVGAPGYNTMAFFPQYERSGIFGMPYYAADPTTKRAVYGYLNLNVDSGEVETHELSGDPVPLYSFVVSPDHTREFGIGVIRLLKIDMGTKTLLDARDQERTQYVGNISSDGSKLYLGGAGPHIFVYDTKTLKLIKKIELSGDMGGALFRAIAPPQ